MATRARALSSERIHITSHYHATSFHHSHSFHLTMHARFTGFCQFNTYSTIIRSHQQTRALRSKHFPCLKCSHAETGRSTATDAASIDPVLLCPVLRPLAHQETAASCPAKIGSFGHCYVTPLADRAQYLPSRGPSLVPSGTSARLMRFA